MIKTLPVEYNSKAFNPEHNRAGRSIPTVILSSGTTHTSLPFYIRHCDLVSIFNVSIPYERHYKNGVETDIPNFHRGQPFKDCIYIEGCEHTFDFMVKEAKFPMVFRDIICGDTLECDAYIRVDISDFQRRLNEMSRR